MGVKEYLLSKVHVIFKKKLKPDGSAHQTVNFFKNVIGAEAEEAEQNISYAIDEMIPASSHGTYLARHAEIRKLPPKGSWESEDVFRARVVVAWSWWQKMGRRTGIEAVLELFGFTANIYERQPKWAHFRIVFSATLGRISWQQLWRYIYRFKAAHTIPIFEPDYVNLDYGRFDDPWPVPGKFDDGGFFDDFVAVEA